MLQECRIRPSLQRVLILDYLRSVHTHPSVDSIYQALLPDNPGLSRTTVYNTLEYLPAAIIFAAAWTASPEAVPHLPNRLKVTSLRIT